MTFLSGAAAILGAPMLKGHILAAEEINADGGFLRKRKIETITAHDAGGRGADVKERKPITPEPKIDCCTAISSSRNTPRDGPVAPDLAGHPLFAGCATGS